jgi:antitoxin component YwqK of YwqJK toxin-antitoxin module
MKSKILLFLALLTFTISLAQEVAPKFEKAGKLVKATYFFDNGSIKQIGFFLNDKLHDEWISFNKEGKKTTIAHYDKGKKTGSWFVLNNGIVKQVTFKANKVIEVKDLKETDLAFTK